MPFARQVLPIALLAALSISAAARAAEAPGPASCDDSRGSLGLAACRLAQQLTPAASGASVTVVELKTDRELPAADELRERVASAVAIALTSGSEAGGARKLRVELSVEKAGGVLRITAELRRATGLWQRTRQRKPSAEQRGFVEVPLDAELRALIPPPPLVVSEVLKVKSPERGVVALACGAMGSEGAQELALVTRNSVRVGHIAKSRFVERKAASWASLSPVAPAPLREPIGSAEVTPEGGLRVGLTDRRDGLELSPELSVTRRFEARFPLPGGGCAARDALGLMATSVSCDAPGASFRASASVDAVAGSRRFQWGRALGSSSLIDLRGSPSTPSSLRLGAQLAVGDADSDGDPELAFSADTFEPSQDKLSVVTVRGQTVTPRFELPAPDIRAIAICGRREGPGMAMLVVATGDELWLLR